MPALLKLLFDQSGIADNRGKALALPATDLPVLDILVPGDSRKPPSSTTRKCTLRTDSDGSALSILDSSSGNFDDFIGSPEDVVVSALMPSQSGAKQTFIVHKCCKFGTNEQSSETIFIDALSGQRTVLTKPQSSRSVQWPSARKHAAACIVTIASIVPSEAAAQPTAPTAQPTPEPVDPKAKGKPAGKDAGKKGAPEPVVTAVPAAAAVAPGGRECNCPLLLMFGGTEGTTGQMSSDLYALHLDGDAIEKHASLTASAGEAVPAESAPGSDTVGPPAVWVKVKTTVTGGGAGPGARMQHSLTTAGSGSKVVLFGGYGFRSELAQQSGAQPSMLNDCWVLDTKTWQWTRLVTTGMPPAPRSQHSTASNAFLPDEASLELRPWQLSVCADLRSVLPIYRTLASALNRQPGEMHEAELLFEQKPEPPPVPVVPEPAPVAEPPPSVPAATAKGAAAKAASAPASAAKAAKAAPVDTTPVAAPVAVAPPPPPKVTSLGPDVVFIFGGICDPFVLAQHRQEVLSAPQLRDKGRGASRIKSGGNTASAVNSTSTPRPEPSDASAAGAPATTEQASTSSPSRSRQRPDDMLDPVIYALVLDEALAEALEAADPAAKERRERALAAEDEMTAKLKAELAARQPPRPPTPPPQPAAAAPTAAAKGKAAPAAGKAAPAPAPSSTPSSQAEPSAVETPRTEGPVKATAVWTSLPAVLPPMAQGHLMPEIEGALLGVQPFRSVMDGDDALVGGSGVLPTGPFAPLPLTLEGDSFMSLSADSVQQGDAPRLQPASQRSSIVGSMSRSRLSAAGPTASLGSGRPSYKSLAHRKHDTYMRRYGHTASSFLISSPEYIHAAQQAISGAALEQGEQGSAGVPRAAQGAGPVPCIGQTHHLHIVLYGGITDAHLRSNAKRLFKQAPAPLDDPALARAAIPAGVLLELLPHEVLKQKLAPPAAELYDGYGGFILKPRDATTGLEVVRRQYSSQEGGGEEGVYEGESDAGVRTGRGSMTWSSVQKGESSAQDARAAAVGLPGSVFSGDWLSYDGVWAEDVPHGPCNQLVFRDGRTFTGSVHNGAMQGHGSLTGPAEHSAQPQSFAASDSCVSVSGWPICAVSGDWEGGVPNGQGAVTYPYGAYEGLLANGLPHGPGTLNVRLDGGATVCAIGEWARGRLHSSDCHWMLTAVSGQHLEVYRGPFLDGYRHGEGAVVEMRNGCHYEGPYKFGRRNGHGKCTYITGDTYVGKFVGDVRSGKGTLLHKNGDQFVGIWENDEKNGPGLFKYITKGTEIQGTWRNGRLLDL